MYVQYSIQGLCQSRLSTADYALFLIASATSYKLQADSSYIAAARTNTQKTHLPLLFRQISIGVTT
jgi:hypothetical protein